jgi:hypothetical protein
MGRPEFVSFNLSVEPDSIPRTFRPLEQKYYGQAKWQIFRKGRIYARGIPSKSVVGKIEDLLEIEIPQGYKKDLEGYFTNFGVIRDGGFSGLSFEDLGGGEGTLHLEDAAGTEHGWMSSGRPRPVKVHPKGSDERRAILADLEKVGTRLHGGPPPKTSVIFTLTSRGKPVGSVRGYASEAQAINDFIDRWFEARESIKDYNRLKKQREEISEMLRDQRRLLSGILDEGVGRMGLGEDVMLDENLDLHDADLNMREVQTKQEWTLDDDEWVKE